MSDLLKKLKERRKERVETKLVDGSTLQCPEGYHDPYGFGECIPISAVPSCPDGWRWSYNLNKCVVVQPPDPLPEGLAEPPFDPVLEKSPAIPNVGFMVGQFLERHPVENILRLKVQMGNEYEPKQGWHRVEFPKEVLNAHVVAVSGPRSAEVPAVILRTDAKVKYMLAFSQGIYDLVVDPLKSAVPNIWIVKQALDGVIDYLIKPLVIGLGNIYGELVYKLIVKPTADITEAVIKDVVPFELPDSWGLERGRSVHTINISNITNTGFDWYSYGEHYINWIAMGITPEDKFLLPDEITQPINDLKSQIDEIRNNYDEKIILLEKKIKDLIAQIGGEPTTPEITRIFPRLRQP